MREARRALAKALDAMDRKASFDRCHLGEQPCKQPAIKAHCVPKTTLRLIADQDQKVFGIDSRAPKAPDHWFARAPLGNHYISSFGTGYWACAEHDALFSPIDDVNIDVSDERNLFLICYKVLAYSTQRVLHTASRLAIPMLDPAVPTPSGFPKHIEAGLERAAVRMSENAMRTFLMKSRFDKLWRSQSFGEIEYRTALWRTTPSMAAIGMHMGASHHNPYGQGELTTVSPEWLVLLPQSYGQLLLTASMRSADIVSSGLHEGMPKKGIEIGTRGNSWTRLQCMKVYEYASDIAISHDVVASASPKQMRNLQNYMFTKSRSGSPKGKMPNLLSVRE